MPTRWLSIYPAVDRILHCFPTIKSYFVSLEDCPVLIKKFFKNVENGDEVSITECYLHFFHNILKLFHETIECLEKNNLLAIEVFSIMEVLKMKLEQRIQDNFLGFKTMTILKLSRGEMQRTQKEFIKWYETALNYLTSRFDFSKNNILSKISVMSLKKDIDFKVVLELVHDLKLETVIDVDELYEEFVLLKEPINIAARNNSNSCLGKWMVIMNSLPMEKKTDGTGSFGKLMNFLFSISPSNAFAERTFSQGNMLWSDVRNRLHIDTLKAELQVKINFNVDCKGFYESVLQEKSLLESARNSKKYKFKKEKD